MHTRDLKAMVQKLAAIPNPTMKQCYEAGFRCAVDGANTENCHFSFFGTHDKMEMWSEGNRDGKERKPKEAKWKNGIST